MQFGLIGKRLSHSYSPEIHGKIADYNYELLEISEDKLCDFFKKRDFCGINVTIPYKEAVIPMLDELSDTAKKIGAVNTVVNRNGKLIGYNTDYYGMLALIRHLGISADGKKVLILGTGGTSKTAYAVFKSLNAREIIFVSRAKKIGSVTYSEACEFHSDAQIILNTTPAGMFPKSDETPINIDAFPNLEGVIDAIYNPLCTNLVLNAKKRNISAEGGLYMLSAQAVYASSLFLGIPADDKKIELAYKFVKSQKENIVLIGMPSCGKTTLGKLLADRLEKDFFDSDDEIVKKIGMPIPEFFEKYGEKEFRKIEKETISCLSDKSGCVIATGGGAVLDKQNVQSLKRNGKIVFLNRPKELLTPTSDRPLSNERDALYKLFDERFDIYKASADIEILADKSPEYVLNDILKELI